jgi:hypothetical protein
MATSSQVVGHGHARHAPHHGTGHLDDAALHGDDLFQPPARALRHGQQAQGLAGGSAVEDDRVEGARVVMLGDPEQARQLVHARDNGRLLGHHVVDPTPRHATKRVSASIP